MRNFETSCPPLQNRPWPYVQRCQRLPDEVAEFLHMPVDQQRSALLELRVNAEEHGRLINIYLAVIYAYRLGYADSPCVNGPDDELELKLEQAKVVLERELMEFLGPPAIPVVESQEELVTALQSLVSDNPGVDHRLFQYLQDEASVEAFRTFLLNDVIRNEIVDDEVAWLVAGHQGVMKEAAAVNLYDECGRGKQQHFHTYWLRMLLESWDSWDELLEFRAARRPWFAGITSNVFAMLLTRSPYKWAAYGHFIISESWVPQHFEPILKGMDRVGLRKGDNDIYFTAHITLDPTHTEELILGLTHQVPMLTSDECSQILWGCQLAIQGAVEQYNRLLAYLPAL